MEHSMEAIHTAIRDRSAVRVSERHGWAAGLTGIAMGYGWLYDSVKVGFVDDAGRYTGEFTRVPSRAVEVL